MYLEIWIIIALVLWIIYLYSRVNTLKQQIGNLYGSILIANWVTGFLDRLKEFRHGLDLHLEDIIDQKRDGSRQLSNALYVLDNDTVKNSLNYLQDFVDQEENDGQNGQKLEIILPPRSWFESAGGANKDASENIEAAYTIVKNIYGDLKKTDVLKVNNELRRLSEDWDEEEEQDA